MAFQQGFLVLSTLALFTFSVQARAQTQRVTYKNRLPVYVGDLINEADASLDPNYAAPLCARLNNVILGKSEKEIEEHAKNCILHIVRFSDLLDPTQTQTIGVENWYVYSSDHFWSLEDLQSNKRLFGAPHASFFFVFLNRAIGPAAKVKKIGVSANVMTVQASNSFKVGQKLRLAGFKDSSLNNQTVMVASANTSEFTASFSHEDFRPTEDPGSVFGILSTTAAPTPDERDATANCVEEELPRIGADGDYPTYTIDAKRKTSANVQHLVQLLGAEGLKITPQSDSSATPAALQQPANPKLVIASLSPRQSAIPEKKAALKQMTTAVKNFQVLLGYSPSAKKCHAPDAEFGGGIVDVAYRPSDISISGSFHKGEGANEHTEQIGKKAPYVVDNEGRYFFDFSVPLTLKKLSEVQYQNTSGTFSPVNVNSTNAFMAIDLFYPAVDVKSPTWTRYPHPLMGVGFARQPLHKILVAGAWGPYFSELYMGIAWIKQPRVAAGSNSCKAEGGMSTAIPNSFGSHFCAQFSIGINLGVTGIASKLGSPK